MQDVNERPLIVRNFLMVKALDCGARLGDVADLHGLTVSTVKEIWQRHLCDPTLLPGQYNGTRDPKERNNATREDMRAAYVMAREMRKDAFAASRNARLAALKQSHYGEAA